MPPVNTLSDIVPPKGMDDAGRAYLYKEIREFCSEETKDLVCPKPLGYVENIPVDDVEHVENAAKTDKRKWDAAAKPKAKSKKTKGKK